MYVIKTKSVKNKPSLKARPVITQENLSAQDFWASKNINKLCYISQKNTKIIISKIFK